MYPRPTEPHPDQLDYVWPASTASWQPCADPELAPSSWSTWATVSPDARHGAREPNGTHMLPSELLAHELGLTLYGEFHPRPSWEHAPPRPAEPDPEQLDPEEWPEVTEWAPVGFGHPEDWDGPHSYALVPAEWLGTTSFFVWSGSELRALKPGYMTAGELYVWQKLHAEPDPEPPDDPDPEPPEPSPELVPAVLAFAGLPADSETVAELVEQHLPIVTAQVRSYTRGRGFTDAGHPDANLRAVIVSATARSVANPTGSGTLRLGNATHNPGVYAGWTLPELAILHGYRRRSA